MVRGNRSIALKVYNQQTDLMPKIASNLIYYEYIECMAVYSIITYSSLKLQPKAYKFSSE